MTWSGAIRRKSIFPGLLAALCALAGLGLSAQTKHAAVEFHIYAGNTHAHTQFTWSHGEQWAKGACAGILVYAPKAGEPFVSTWADGYVKKTCPSIYVVNGWQYPAPSVTLKLLRTRRARLTAFAAASPELSRYSAERSSWARSSENRPPSVASIKSTEKSLASAMSRKRLSSTVFPTPRSPVGITPREVTPRVRRASKTSTSAMSLSRPVRAGGGEPAPG